MLPANQIKVATLADYGSATRHWIVVVNMTDEQVKAIPRVKKERGQWVPFDDDRRATPPTTAPSAAPRRDPEKPSTPPKQQ